MSVPTEAGRGEEGDDVTASLLMNSEPEVLVHTARVEEAAEQIMAHRYRSLPVVDEEGCYLGIVGVNGMLRLVLPKAAIVEKGLKGLHSAMCIEVDQHPTKVEDDMGYLGMIHVSILLEKMKQICNIAIRIHRT